MRTLNYFSKTFSTIRNFRTKESNLSSLINHNELTHPRFGLTPSKNTTSKKEDPNSLLFLMYSKENETLFI